MATTYASHLFTPADVRWLTGVTEGQYRYWISEGVVRPSVLDEPDRPFGRMFSFADLVVFRAIKLLRDMNLPLDELRKVQPWVLNHLDVEELRVHGSLHVTEATRLVESRTAVSARPVDFDSMVHDLVGRIEHSRKLKDQIGRIECSPHVQGGEPVIAGTRVPVETIKRFDAAGYSPESIRGEYPHLTLEDIRAAIDYSPESSDLAVAD